ncbi:MAG: carbonic anhydrase family protein [Phycisphaerales bacterium JB061]
MPTKAKQDALTPELVLAELKAGNERFIKDESIKQDWKALAKTTAKAQYPKAVVLGCIDSRVPVEIVFDQFIGDVFVARVAGNFVNDDILGSMEFGTAVAGSKLVVVLGHTSCGAVMGALDGAKLGHLTGLLEKIKPAIDASVEGDEEIASTNESLLDRVTAENVRLNVKKVVEQSSVMAEAIERGDLKVVGAIYNLETGRVTWLDD